ncbi:MAG TPA: alpha/beta hydrolase [Aeromicrobium sp.]|nr:alpha/beta hydrolase [Aeromicrobium sp.]
MRKLAKLLVFIVIPAMLVNAWVVSRQTREAATFGGGRVVSITGPDLNVREYGSGSATGAIVLLHGYASSIEWWADVAPELADETGRKVIAVDLVGHGGSESPLDSDAYGANGQAVAVARALAALKAEDVVLVGHSMGGHIATAVAQREPEVIERVVVVDTFGAPRLRDLGLLADATCWPVVGAALDRVRPLDAVTKSSLQAGFAADFEVPTFAYRSLKQMIHRGVCESTAGDEMNAKRPVALQLAQLGKPVKVIWGARDTLTPTAANVGAYENAGLTPEIVKGVGHSPQVEAPDEVVGIIAGFVK